MLRPTALITPTDTLGSVLPSTNPNGLPMAMLHSPMSRSDDVPSGATGRSRASMRSTARSFWSSSPTSVASYVVPSRSATVIVEAPATTWALVTMTPSLRTMNPEPMPARERCPLRPPKYISNMSTGTRSTDSVCTVTTAGAMRSTATVIAVRREASMAAEGEATRGSGGVSTTRAPADVEPVPCAAESAGSAPTHPTATSAEAATIERRATITARRRGVAGRRMARAGCRPWPDR